MLIAHICLNFIFRDDEEQEQIGSPLKYFGGSIKKTLKDQKDERPTDKPLFSLSTSLEIDLDDDYNTPVRHEHLIPHNSTSAPTNVPHSNEKKRKVDQLTSNNVNTIDDKKSPGSTVSNVNSNIASGSNKKQKLSGVTPRLKPASQNNINSNDKDTQRSIGEDLIPSQKLTLWRNLIRSFAPELVESLQKDLMSQNTINIRYY